jgi:ORF6N domain-containing protein
VPEDLVTIPDSLIENSIVLVRGHKVILDRELARLYGVSTRTLNQAVKRNLNRFPEDFMFQLTADETAAWHHTSSERLRSQIVILNATNLRSQIVTLKKSRGKHVKYRPYAFTEHGILMLSSVLKSERAVQVNIQIMRTFVRLREILASNADLNRRLDDLERNYDTKFKVVFDAIRTLLAAPEKTTRKIGFRGET